MFLFHCSHTPQPQFYVLLLRLIDAIKEHFLFFSLSFFGANIYLNVDLDNNLTTSKVSSRMSDNKGKKNACTFFED